MDDDVATLSKQMELANQHHLLPHIPGIVVRLQQLLPTGNFDVGEIEQLISSDVALVAKILRIVNSAYYGLPQRLDNLRFAVAYLGLNEIYRIVVTASLIESFSQEVDADAFWHHSYFTAMVAKRLAQDYERMLSPGELWPAALLHDIGQMVSRRFYGERYEQALSHCVEHQCLFSEAERALDLPPHTVLGGILSDRWHLPALVLNVCLHHEEEEPDEETHSGTTRSALRVVMAADAMAHITAGGLCPERNSALQAKVCRLLDCTGEEFILLMGTVYEIKQDVDVFLRELL
jgi:HD-like signal output (HDOD) protein